MWFLSELISVLFWPGLLIAVIVFVFSRKKHAGTGYRWSLPLSLSQEDALSQSFYVLSLLFLLFTAFAINRDLGDPLEWYLILFGISLIGLVFTYILNVPYTLLFSVAGLFVWWLSRTSAWLDAVNIRNPQESVFLSTVFFIFILFGLLSYIHKNLSKYKRFAQLYVTACFTFITLFVFILSTHVGLQALEEATRGTSVIGLWQVLVSLLVFLISDIFILTFISLKRWISLYELIGFTTLLIIFSVIMFLPEQTFFARSQNVLAFIGNKLAFVGMFWAVVFNIFMFLEFVGLIFLGYMHKVVWKINLGAGLLFIFIVVKYFDWFFSFLDKSIFFIGAGLILFVLGGAMEKMRRTMIAEVKDIKTHAK